VENIFAYSPQGYSVGWTSSFLNRPSVGWDLLRATSRCYLFANRPT